MNCGCDVVFNLLTQSRDGMVDRTGGRRVDIAPNFTQQFVTVDHTLLPLCEIPQHLELTMGQVQVHAVTCGGQQPEVDEDAPEQEYVE